MLGTTRSSAVADGGGRGDSGCRECVVYRDCLDKLQVRFLECQSMIASVFRMPFQQQRFDQLNNNNNSDTVKEDKLKASLPERCSDQLYELLTGCNDAFGEQDCARDLGAGVGSVFGKSALPINAFDINCNSVGFAGDSQLSENDQYDDGVVDKENVPGSDIYGSGSVGIEAESEHSNKIVSEDGVWDVTGTSQIDDDSSTPTGGKSRGGHSQSPTWSQTLGHHSCDNMAPTGENMEESYSEHTMGSIGNDGNLNDPDVEDQNGMVTMEYPIGALSKQDSRAQSGTRDGEIACFSSGVHSSGESTHLEFLNSDVGSRAEESGEQLMPGNDLLNGAEGFINKWQLGGYKNNMEFCSAAESSTTGQNSYSYASPFDMDGNRGLMSNKHNTFIDHNHPASRMLDRPPPTVKKRNYAKSRAFAGRQPNVKRRRVGESMFKPKSCISGLRSSEFDSKSALEFGLTDWNEMPPVPTFPLRTADEPSIEATNPQPRSFVDDEEPHANSQSSNPVSSFLNAMMAEKNSHKKANMSGPLSFTKNPYFDNSLQSLGVDLLAPRYQQLCLNTGQLTNHSMSTAFHQAGISGAAEEPVQTRTISTLVVRRAIRPFVPPFKDPSESRDHQIYSYHRKSDGRKYRKRCRLCWQFYRIRKDVNTFCGTCEDNPPLCAEPCFSEYHGHDFERNLLAIPSNVVPAVPQERPNDGGCATSVATSPPGALQIDSSLTYAPSSGSAPAGARNLVSPQHQTDDYLGVAGNAGEESQSCQESLDSKPAAMVVEPAPNEEGATSFVDSDIVVKVEEDNEIVI